jgi:hypothetical protein
MKMKVNQVRLACRLTATVVVILLTSAATGGSVQPTACEQYVLELVNRARMDPVGEAVRYGIDLNKGLLPGTIAPDPKQPLAFQGSLIDAARKHSVWQMQNNTVDHMGAGGSGPMDRAIAAGHPLAYLGVCEDIGCGVTLDDPPDYVAMAEQAHHGLFWDGLHRDVMLRANHFEIGVGIATGMMVLGSGAPVATLISTEDFVGVPGWTPVLTGVAYDDCKVVEDAFYTPGEGLGGIAVTAVRDSDHARYTTSTFGSGGYSLALPPGTYTVTASGTGLGTITFSGVAMADQNVKIDFVPGSSPPPPPPSPTSPSPEVRITQGVADVTVEITLDAGSLEGQNADWWILAQKGSSWYSWDSQTGAWKGGLHPSYQKPLCDSPITKVLQARLPAGKYTFYFAVDTNVNGRVDMNAIYYGKASVAVAKQ